MSCPFCNTHSVDDDDGQMTMRCKPTTECQIESAQPHYNNCRLKIAIYLARKVRGRPRMSNACHKMAKILPQAETDIRWCGWTDPFRGVLTGGVGHGHWDVTRLGESHFQPSSWQHPNLCPAKSGEEIYIYLVFCLSAFYFLIF